jgi:serine/threonine-protein phosphatase 2A activator
MLETLESWTKEIKAIAQPMRYGNKAFRQWHQRLSAEGLNLCKDILPEGKKEAALELLPYLLDSFGNSTRIDYGTGHETTFMILMCKSRDKRH